MELTDDQYLLAYEAISAAIVELGQIDARDVQDWIELYLGQDAELLLAQVRGPADSNPRPCNWPPHRSR